MAKSSATAPAEIVVTSVRIERAKLDRLKEIAEGHRRTVSQEVRWLIDQAIAADGEREAS